MRGGIVPANIVYPLFEARACTLPELAGVLLASPPKDVGQQG
jgi:hypothetical protein